jgi:hypothetical protein
MDGSSGSMGVKPGKWRAKESKTEGHYKKLGSLFWKTGRLGNKLWCQRNWWRCPALLLI